MEALGGPLDGNTLPLGMGSRYAVASQPVYDRPMEHIYKIESTRFGKMYVYQGIFVAQ